MDKLLHGVVRGNMIELTDTTGLIDGAEVEVMVRLPLPTQTWGEGIHNSAGGWADFPEMDTVMEQIQQDRKRERRPQESP